VRSILTQTSSALRVQIIIVDNNSTAEEFKKLGVVETSDTIQLLRSKINLGFSGANMIGVQHADADYYYFLNNDCVLLNDCPSLLYHFMEEHPVVANASGEMFIGNGTYEYNFRYFPTLSLKIFGSGILRLFRPADYPSRHTRFTVPTRVDLVNGSSMFVRAQAFEQIGGFDTRYFLYCEEEDIALRLFRAGYQTYLVPEARYQHFVSKSTRQDGTINLPFLKEFYISFLYYFAKNYGSVYRWAIQSFYVVKIGRKFYKNWDYARLAFFIAKGAPATESLRFKQSLSSLETEQQQ
jgi:GT2 family glycosyltransferase